MAVAGVTDEERIKSAISKEATKSGGEEEGSNSEVVFSVENSWR